MKAVELLKKIKKYVIEGETYLKSLDCSLRDFVSDNEYTSSQGKIYEALLEFEFGEDVEIIFEWLYDYSNTEIFNLSAEEIINILSEKWKIDNEKYGG